MTARAALMLLVLPLAGCAAAGGGLISRSGGDRGGEIRVYGAGQAQLRAMVDDMARLHGVDPAVARAVIHVESRWQCDVRSSHGAVGLMQVLPATARGVGVHGNLRDCRTGAEAGLRYLAEAKRRHGPGCAGISAYNHGIHRAPRCTGYGRRVLQLAGRDA
jgi:soluble lytic murein transglycosylase-like protein